MARPLSAKEWRATCANPVASRGTPLLYCPRPRCRGPRSLVLERVTTWPSSSVCRVLAGLDPRAELKRRYSRYAASTPTANTTTAMRAPAEQAPRSDASVAAETTLFKYRCSHVRPVTARAWTERCRRDWPGVAPPGLPSPNRSCSTSSPSPSWPTNWAVAPACDNPPAASNASCVARTIFACTGSVFPAGLPPAMSGDACKCVVW